MKIKRIWSGLLLSSLTFTAFAGGGEGENNTATPTSSNSFIRTGYLMPVQDSTSGVSIQQGFNYLGLGSKKPGGLTAPDLKISGVVRGLTMYRSMSEYYVDMINSQKNISFTDYPVTSVATNPNAGYPALELNLQSHVTKYFQFNVGYSFSHSMSGQFDNGGAKKLNAVQNLNFTGRLKVDKVMASVAMGEVLWTNLSRFTFGQPEYRDNYFNRLPWDWYRESFQRYREYFSLSSNIGNQGLFNSPLQGVIGFVEWLPAQTSLKVIYGRSNRTVGLSNSTKGFPGYNVGYRLEKILFERGVRGTIGGNLYMKRAEQDFIGNRRDNNTIGSLDFNLKVRKVNLSGELGYGKIVVDSLTPGEKAQYGDLQGFGATLKAEFDRRAVLWPFSVEFYHINKNLASLDGSILNSNAVVGDGGYATENIYDNMYFPNISSEVGQIANNRQGVNLRFEANLGKFKVQAGYAASQEIEKLTDTVTIQHRVNDFSRSRFRPWFQAGGPYHRIKSFWFRTFETITVTDRDANGNAKGYLNREKFGFNTLEFLTKGKFDIGKYELVLLNLTTYNTISLGFNAFGGGNDQIIGLFYNDFTAAFKLTKQLSLVGNFAFETVKGSVYTDLSPDAEKLSAKNEDRIIDQFGTMSAMGIDFDLNKTTSLHFRTKYMTHEDKNFLRDKYNGWESTFELKIFF